MELVKFGLYFLALTVGVSLAATMVHVTAKFLLRKIGLLGAAQKARGTVGDGASAAGSWLGHSVIKYRWLTLLIVCIGGSVLLARHGI